MWVTRVRGEFLIENNKFVQNKGHRCGVTQLYLTDLGLRFSMINNDFIGNSALLGGVMCLSDSIYDTYFIKGNRFINNSAEFGNHFIN